MSNEKEFELDIEEGYIVAPSPIGRNTNLSLRVKGLMYVFFTLPPEWDYSLSGLATLNRDGKIKIKKEN